MAFKERLIGIGTDAVVRQPNKFKSVFFFVKPETFLEIGHQMPAGRYAVLLCRGVWTASFRMQISKHWQVSNSPGNCQAVRNGNWLKPAGAFSCSLIVSLPHRWCIRSERALDSEWFQIILCPAKRGLTSFHLVSILADKHWALVRAKSYFHATTLDRFILNPFWWISLIPVFAADFTSTAICLSLWFILSDYEYYWWMPIYSLYGLSVRSCYRKI